MRLAVVRLALRFRDVELVMARREVLSHRKLFDHGLKSFVVSTHVRLHANVNAWATSEIWMGSI